MRHAPVASFVQRWWQGPFGADTPRAPPVGVHGYDPIGPVRATAYAEEA